MSNVSDAPVLFHCAAELCFPTGAHELGMFVLHEDGQVRWIAMDRLDDTVGAEGHWKASDFKTAEKTRFGGGFSVGEGFWLLLGNRDGKKFRKLLEKF